MSAPVVDFSMLDADIALAWMDVQDARRAWAHSPNPQTIAVEQTAVAALNKLLEFRFIVQNRR